MQQSHCGMTEFPVKSFSPLILLINQDKVDFLLQMSPPQANGKYHPLKGFNLRNYCITWII